MTRNLLFPAFAFLALVTIVGPSRLGAAESAKVTVQWDKVVRVSKTNASLLVVINPMYRRGSPIHDAIFKSLRDLGADCVAHLGWYPYPKLAVAELEPPKDGKTSWDFSLIDPIMMDFFEATRGHPVMVNFSTIPQWMFKTPNPVPYPPDPDQVSWTYQQGTELRDPTLKELADYYARLAGWYTKGGFTDEYGKWHESGHHFKIDYWGVLNEIEIEHFTSPQDYTARYDAIVAAVHQVAPEMKFVGLMLALPTKYPQYFEYFLNPKNHQPGIPMDVVAYHFYAVPSADQTHSVHHQYTVFDMAEQFLTAVRYIELIRQRLSPGTATMVNELGILLPEDFAQALPGYVYRPVDDSFRNRYGALYAFIFAELTRLGIDVACETQLVGFPSQFPSATMIDWETGKLNATYWVLKLLRENVGPGDKVAEARVDMPSVAFLQPAYIHATGFVKPDGTRKVLLVNKRERAFDVTIPEARGATVQVVDLTTRSNPPASSRLEGETFTLQGMGVAVVTLPK